MGHEAADVSLRDHSKTLVVGATRAGGIGAGSNGNDSTWDTSVVVAKGGTGGQANGVASTTGSSTGCVGDVCYAGGSGGKGVATYGAGGGGGGLDVLQNFQISDKETYSSSEIVGESNK